MPETVFEVLKREHKEIKRLLKRADTDPRQFSHLAQKLTMHVQTEEDVLYTPLRNDRHLHSMILEGFAEHHVVDLIMREIERSKTGTDEWHAKLKVMKENLEHHIEEEEGEMFKQARQVFDKDTLEELGERMQTRKRSGLAA